MMKHSIYCLVTLTFIASISACNSNRFAIDPTSPENTPGGDVTLLGQPTGNAVSKVLGPEGGSLFTNDGTGQLVIPAGALTQATTITLQPITNQAPNGMGVAYRLLPADLNLGKPATLIAQYSDGDLAGNTPETMGMASQHSDKIWYSAVGQTINAATHQISAPVPHFGDWSLYKQFMLLFKHRPDEAIAYYGETVDLEIRQLIPVSVSNEDPLRTRIIRSTDQNGYKWALAGHGKLTPNQSVVSYTAPAYHPEQNPVTITATITPANSTAKIVLKQDVFIGSGYIKFTFNGQSTFCTTVSMEDKSTGYATILGASNTMPINITFRSASFGVWPFGDFVSTDGKSGIALALIKDGQQDRYDSGHSRCSGQDWFANGQLALMSYVKGKVARGTFSGNLISRNSTCTSAGPAITGEFLIRERD